MKASKFTIGAITLIVFCTTTSTTTLGFAILNWNSQQRKSFIFYKNTTPTMIRNGESIILNAINLETDTASIEHLATTSKASSSSKLGPNAPTPGAIRKAFPSFPWQKFPNWLTYSRCIAIPFMAILFYVPGCQRVTSLLFAIASFTDWLDGYLARRWDINSDFGAFLDPVADKLMVSTALILLAGRYGPIVAIPACIILGRELAISALREWMAERGKRGIVKVGFQGKLKTALTMITLTCMLYIPPPYDSSEFRKYDLFWKGSVTLLYLCTIVTVTSGILYLRAAIPFLFAADGKKE